MSFIGHSNTAIYVANCLLRAFPPTSRPKLIIGGPDVGYSTEGYIDSFLPLYSDQHLEIKFVIYIGPGEPYIKALTETGFSLSEKSIFMEQDLEHQLVRGAQVLRQFSASALADQGWRRYYDLSLFGDVGVKWASGCKGGCKFCCEPPRRADYRLAQMTSDEADHIVTQDASKLLISAPDFLNRPSMASRIIDSLPSGVNRLHFSARVDSLYLAVKHYPNIWQKFAAKRHRIDLGVESFIPERLVWLGKYRNLKQAAKQQERLAYLLEFFRPTKTSIGFFIMPLDWRITLAEAKVEAEQLQCCLEQYDYIFLASQNIAKIVSYATGSNFSSTMSSQDFYRFDDPRLLFLHYLIKNKRSLLYESIEIDSRATHLLEVVISKVLLRCYLLCLERLAMFEGECFDLEPILMLRERKAGEQKILDTFYDQLKQKREKLKQSLDEIFNEESQGMAKMITQELIRTLCRRIDASELSDPEKEKEKNRIVIAVVSQCRTAAV
ncbi:hypothetical protein COT42_08175 [Candidatus Saganbacteria bacterium CG08_land_8_20_14_0_20_45_16]|uniref:Elp3/MiaA/NifB-like radical SAM core domain-containing protein n=1 Tax=Candidatus Saganbacteria bacterium CG08_land_8_20_14_0_20_45_16 TaxID=2014293 RepID=A0A2H0XW66_UNCSA|nr:MAG: hypothetical protein COT42_08175 [Candidatus Saganbacteria bacterium CG08_land_8_20_14_0_20_45_16]